MKKFYYLLLFTIGIQSAQAVVCSLSVTSNITFNMSSTGIELAVLQKQILNLYETEIEPLVKLIEEETNKKNILLKQIRELEIQKTNVNHEVIFLDKQELKLLNIKK